MAKITAHLCMPYFLTTPKVVVLAKNLDRANQRLTESTISNSPKDWGSVATPDKRPTQNTSISAANAAFGILIALDLIQEAENAERPRYIDTDILEVSKQAATVVITLDGLLDDEIKRIRYRIALEKTPAAWQLKAIGQQTQKWPDRSPGKQSIWRKPTH
ncbi:MAG: hypothetical protein ACI8XO_000285 [Verrucomicrobiales bacterium]|jgi:hypothetical protein